jgi:hypothetical protein
LVCAGCSQSAVPKQEGVAPKRGGVVPRRDGVALRREGVVPKRGGVVAKRGDVAPKRAGVVPKLEGVVPKRAVSDGSISVMIPRQSKQRQLRAWGGKLREPSETARERSRAWAVQARSTDKVLHHYQATGGHAETPFGC